VQLTHFHKWAMYFLMAVGAWNFVGAGVFGFLINLPIVSYFQVGTTLTPNHGHAAMFGVFGMLSSGAGLSRSASGRAYAHHENGAFRRCRKLLASRRALWTPQARRKKTAKRQLPKPDGDMPKGRTGDC
jgi:hypothetical protein